MSALGHSGHRPLYSITSSARSKKDSRIERLRALAVLRLTASSENIGTVRSIGHQTSREDELPVRAYQWDAVLFRRFQNHFAHTDDERIGCSHQTGALLARQCNDRPFDVSFGPYMRGTYLDTGLLRQCLE